MPNLDAIIDQVKTLPPAPRILPQLLSLLQKDDAAPSEVVRLIRFDPVLTAQVLRRCNSAHYAFAEPVRDVQTAVVRLGTSEVFRSVASFLGERALGAAQAGYGLARGELWTHSGVTAIACQTVAREIGSDEWIAFTAALLHDIGKLILSTALEGAYDQLMEQTESSQRAFLEVERDLLGFDHAQIGGRLLARWNFPADLVAAVSWHHHPAQAAGAERLAACVHLGDVLAHMLGHGYGYQAYALRCQSDCLDILKITSRDIEALLIQTAACADEFLAPETSAQ